MSQATKDLLSDAAGPSATADQSWHAERVDRLYFSDPNDLNAAGQVDALSGGDDPTPYVRVELWVRPKLAAQIIGLVTGRTESVEMRLRHEITKELRSTGAVEVAAPTCPVEVISAIPDDPRGYAARDAVAKADLERRDHARLRELNMLIAQQDADEASDDDEDDEDEESEGDDRAA